MESAPQFSLRLRALVVLLAGTALLVGSRSIWSQSPTTEKGKPKTTPTASAKRTQPTSALGPSMTPRIATAKVDAFEREITISCASCHANFASNAAIRSGDELQQFHQGLEFAHGKLTCLSCHHSKNYNSLRLANEQPLDFSQTQTLCGQCHSKQSNDYERGAHGGMNGHWSLLRGGRIRKLCIDCHDPHSPAFPAMIPTFRPRDRFLAPSQEKQSGAAHE